MERARRPWLSLFVICLGTFAILLDTTIVNVALPSMITDLHASLDQAVWVMNSYLLVFCALLIVSGRGISAGAGQAAHAVPAGTTD